VNESPLYSYRKICCETPLFHPRERFSATLFLLFSQTTKPVSTPRSLTTRLILRSLFAVIFVAVLLFVPAGSLRYWQGWVFMAILFLPMPFTSAYFLKRDPQLVERRLRTQEKVSEQKTIIRWAQLIFFGSLLIPGLDYRFGWSRVPLWLTILSQLFVFAGYLITLWVMKENSFASRTIQIDEGQRVISTGPYRLVRHPMYFGAVLMLLFMSPALGSWWALPGFYAVIPLIVLRLLHEEKMLCRDLLGYSDYCLRTRSRLLPLLW
jgi:protein-S-isoprenylcysteine O-methyltransferase Ste14